MKGVLIMEAFSTSSLDCASCGASKLKIFMFSPESATYMLISLEMFPKIKISFAILSVLYWVEGRKEVKVRFKLLILVRVVSVSLHVLK